MRNRAGTPAVTDDGGIGTAHDVKSHCSHSSFVSVTLDDILCTSHEDGVGAKRSTGVYRSRRSRR